MLTQERERNIQIQDELNKDIVMLMAELEQVKWERDAYFDSMKGICATCKKAKYCMLSPVPKCPNWQWRGVKEAEHEP